MTTNADLPIVLVAADVREADGYRWHAVAEQYLRALREGADVVPLILPALDSIDIKSVLTRVDGVLFPGSRSNVHPARYGANDSVAARPYDTARDAVSLPLISAALEHQVPFLAVCRGMQELNVAQGGTLTTEVHALPGRADHRAPDSDDQSARFALRQEIAIQPNGVLASILDDSTITVNSLHRQAIDTLGGGLSVEAVAPDGTIEAVSVSGAKVFSLGVQWHPEYWVTTDAPSRALFRAFGEAVRTARAEKRAAT